VFSSIGIIKQKDRVAYMDVDYQGNANLLEKAKKSGISKFIYISVFNAHEMKQLKAIQVKLRFEQVLKKSGMDYVIIRPNGFFFDMMEYLQMAKKGKGYVFGTSSNKINPIHGQDLAEICVEAINRNEKEINVGGPDVLTHNEILKIAFNPIDNPVKISRIPI